VILNAKRSSHWLDGAMFSPARVRWKVREVEAGRGSVRGRSTACFFSTDGLCRDVDAGVLVMYTSLPAGEEFSSVFTCFPLLGCVCVCEEWCGVACTFYSLFFSCFFCYCCYSVYHTVPLQSVFLKSCTFLGRIGSKAYCYRCSLVCLSVSAGYHREPCKNG